MTAMPAPDELRAIATAISEHTAAIQGMTEALLADQVEARKQADRRFDKQARKLNRQTWAIVAVIALVGGSIWAQHEDTVRRDELAAVAAAQADARSKNAAAQRDCGDTIQNATIGRLSDLATTARFETDERGAPVLDARGMPIQLPPEKAGQKLAQLLGGVSEASRALKESHDICYGPNGPDPTPLDGDRTK